MLLGAAPAAHSQTFAVSVSPQPLGGSDTFAPGGSAAGNITADSIDDYVYPFHRLVGTVTTSYVGVVDGATSQLIPGREHIQPDLAVSPSQWGSAICMLGDLNGDGSSEYAIGDWTANRVVVYMGDGSSNSNLYPAHILCEIEASGVTAPTTRLGISLAAAGDINGDGYPDLLVGDSRIKLPTAAGNSSIGAVYIISGWEMLVPYLEIEKGLLNGIPKPASHPTLSVDVNIGRITMDQTLTGVRFFGTALAGGLDANGDTTPDILITAGQVNYPLGASEVQESGVMLFSGKRFSRPIHTYVFPSPQFNYQLDRASFGRSIDFVHNVEIPATIDLGGGEMVSTEWNDILIGDPGASYNPGSSVTGDHGFAFVFSSTPNSFDLLEVQEGDKAWFQNRYSGTNMGAKVRRAGLVNSDAYGDYWVSESKWRDFSLGDTVDGYVGRGRVHLIGGRTSFLLTPNSATYHYKDSGAEEYSAHGRDMASSGLARVADPTGGTFPSENFGFTCRTQTPTVIPPVASTPYWIGQTAIVFRP